MADFKATVKYASRELSGKEKVMLKDTTRCTKLDEATGAGDLVLAPSMYAVLSIHNDKATPTDYENIIICDEETGDRYITGSPSFMRQFESIWEDMKDETEPWNIVVYRKESKNYNGKYFITCSIM